MKKLVLILFCVLFPVSAWSLPFIGAETGLLFMMNLENGGAPSPVLLQGIGITLPLVADEGFTLDTGLLIYGTWYQFLGGRAIPADVERADTIWTLFAQFDLKTGFNAKLSDKLVFGATIGPALIFPFPLFANDAGAAFIGPMYEYFYFNLKFLYAEQELFLRWLIANEINLTFKIRTLYQIAALWDLPEISRLNGLMFQAIISIEVKLPS